MLNMNFEIIEFYPVYDGSTLSNSQWRVPAQNPSRKEMI
jgi:hypothetical protein